MKYLILLALIIPTGIFGQTTKTNAQNAPEFLIDSGVVSTALKYDTVPCIMQVSDTNHIGWGKTESGRYCPLLINYEKNPDGICGGYVTAIRGYKVSHKEWSYHPDYIIVNEQQIIVYDSYLDDKKQPLKLFVWMSKEIK